MDLESLCSGILFCISLVALIIACLAYTKKNQGGAEYCSLALGKKLKRKKYGEEDGN